MSLKIIRASGADLFGDPNVAEVGTTPLSDLNDATYLQLPPGAVAANYLLETLPSYSVADPINLHVRLQLSISATSDDDDWRVIAQIATDAEQANQIGGFSDGTGSDLQFPVPASAANAIVDVVAPIDLVPFGTTEAGVAAALEEGAYLSFQFVWQDGETEPDWLRIYEAWIEVGVVSPCYQTLAVVGLPDTATVASNAVGSVDAYTAGRTVTDLTVAFTASATSASDTVPVGIRLGTAVLDVFGGSKVGPFATDRDQPLNFLVTADGLPREYSTTITQENLTWNGWDAISQLKPDLESGMEVEFYADLDPGSGDSATITAASLQVGHKCVVNVPPLRRHPRPYLRRIPPPPSSRHVGGYR